MIWLWVVLGFFVVVLPLLVPVKVNFQLDPLEAKVVWGPWVGLYQESRFRMFLFGWVLPTEKKQKKKAEKPPKSTPKKRSKKAKKNKPKKTKIDFTWGLAKKLWAHPVPRLLLLRLKTFMVKLIKSFRWTKLHVVYGSNDPFVQGNLAGLFALVPQSRRFQVSSAFEEVTQVKLGVNLYLWRLLVAVFSLLVSLPYLKARRLYKEIKQPV